MLARLLEGDYLSDCLRASEKDVYRCLGRGMTNPQIADELIIGLRTVESHVASILGKLAVCNRTLAGILAPIEAVDRGDYEAAHGVDE